MGGGDLSEEDIISSLRKVDKTGTGVVTFEQFKEWCVARLQPWRLWIEKSWDRMRQSALTGCRCCAFWQVGGQRCYLQDSVHRGRDTRREQNGQVSMHIDFRANPLVPGT